MRNLLFILSLFFMACRHEPSEFERKYAGRLFDTQVARSLVEEYYKEYGDLPETFREIGDRMKGEIGIPQGFSNEWELVQISDAQLLVNDIVAFESFPRKEYDSIFYIYYCGDGKFEFSNSKESFNPEVQRHVPR